MSNSCSMHCQPYNYIKVADITTDLPITVAQVKEQLKIPAGNTSQDAYIEQLIKAATLSAEHYTKLDLTQKQFKCFLDCFHSNGCYELRKGPFISVDLLQYFVSGALTTIDASVYYATQSQEGFSTIAPNVGEQWPTNGDNRLQSIEITFTAGYGAGDVPIDIQQAMLMHVANLYVNRGDCTQKNCAKLMPCESGATYSQYQVIDLRIC